jgi:hypothetical protein
MRSVFIMTWVEGPIPRYVSEFLPRTGLVAGYFLLFGFRDPISRPGSCTYRCRYVGERESRGRGEGRSGEKGDMAGARRYSRGFS